MNDVDNLLRLFLKSLKFENFSSFVQSPFVGKITLFNVFFFHALIFFLKKVEKSFS